MDDPQKVKLKEFRQEGDHAILALETPIAVYDGAATLELTLRKTDWRTWQVSEINDLYHFVAQAADLQQNFPFRSLIGTILYYDNEPDKNFCSSWVADKLIEQKNLPQARIILECVLTKPIDDYNLPVSLTKAGKLKKALNTIDLMKPNSVKVNALANMAKVFGQQGNEQQADKLFTVAFDLAESLHEIRERELALMNLSHTLAELGNIDEALELTDLIDNNGIKITALVNITAAIALSGDVMRADTLFSQLFKQFDVNDVSIELYQSLARANHLDKALELARSPKQKDKSTQLIQLGWGLTIERYKTAYVADVLEEALMAAQMKSNEKDKYHDLGQLLLLFACIGEFDKALSIARSLEHVKNIDQMKERIKGWIVQFSYHGKFDKAIEAMSLLPESMDNQERTMRWLSFVNEAIFSDLLQTQKAELAKRIMVDELHIPMPTTLYAAQPSPLQSPQQQQPAQAVAEKVEKEDEKTLSREKAAKLITAFYHYPAPVSATLDTKDDYCYGFTWDGAMKIKRKTWDAMKAAGGIDYKITRQKNPGQYNMGCTDEFHITLTDEGLKHFIRGDNESFAIVAACEKVFLEVTGITDFEFGVKGKKIDYLWMLANPTPFSVLENDCIEEINRPQQGEALAVLYDDGWRIVEQ